MARILVATALAMMATRASAGGWQPDAFDQATNPVARAFVQPHQIQERRNSPHIWYTINYIDAQCEPLILVSRGMAATPLQYESILRASGEIPSIQIMPAANGMNEWVAMTFTQIGGSQAEADFFRAKEDCAVALDMLKASGSITDPSQLQ